MHMKSISRDEPQINIGTIGPIVEQTTDDFSKYHWSIYCRLLFLNLVVLWAYQSLISAQNYYIKFFANDHLDFWGTVAVGWSMFIFHIIQLYFSLYKFGFSKRIVPGFIIYILISILVVIVKNGIVLIVAFACVGAVNTITESPLYGIAGLFPIGAFTQAVQFGNGLAGFLNVLVNTIIRLIVLLFHSKIDPDQLSFYIFIGVLIVLCLSAVYTYYRLIVLLPVQTRINQQMETFQREKSGNFIEEKLSFWSLSKVLKIPLFVQFYVLFISLFLWPGIPCRASNNRWFNAGGKDWWCSPFVIGSFNFGDLLGRIIALVIHQYFSERISLFFSLCRTLFLLIVFYRNHLDNIFLLSLIFLLGFSNGLLATVTFMVRPKTIRTVNNCERAAYLMTGALYLGIASGSTVAAALTLTHSL